MQNPIQNVFPNTVSLSRPSLNLSGSSSLLHRSNFAEEEHPEVEHSQSKPLRQAQEGRFNGEYQNEQTPNFPTSGIHHQLMETDSEDESDSSIAEDYHSAFQHSRKANTSTSALPANESTSLLTDQSTSLPANQSTSLPANQSKSHQSTSPQSHIPTMRKWRRENPKIKKNKLAKESLRRQRKSMEACEKDDDLSLVRQGIYEW
jgi:hypothetical protein